MLFRSPAALAAVPVGWSVAPPVDGGTSSIGASVATSGNVAAVGAPFATLTSGGTPAGAVLVYTNSGSGWTSQQVSAPSPIDGGNFGTSVAMSGSLLAVGAAGTPPAAYVFGADGGSYQLQQAWSDPAADTNGSFGGSIAVYSGPGGANYVAVTAPPGSANPAGAVYVSRQLPGGAWTNPPQTITNASFAAFGISVAFAGNGDLLVGDPGTGGGQVLVYTPEPGGWAQNGTLPAALDGGTLSQFGNAIAASNDLVVVTAPGSADTGKTYNGAAFVFAASDAGVWTQQAVLTGSAPESFGNFAPAVQGGLVAVGSAINTASSGAGQVDVWALNNGAWVPVPAAGLKGDSYYGQAVGIAGDALFIGDTSALGAASIDEVTSALFVATAIYPDAGAGTDAGTGDAGGGDATVPGVDGSTPGVDGSSPVSNPDAASGGDGSAEPVGSSGGGGGGCGCVVAGEAGDSGALAFLFEGAIPLLAWAARRRGGA